MNPVQRVHIVEHCLDGNDYVLQNCKVAREVVVLVEICNVALYLSDCTRGLLDGRQGPCASVL